jgi:predicted nucleotidyltransferase
VTAAYQQEIDQFRETVATQLPEAVVGVFLYGSLATGFEHDESDVDLLFAFQEEPTTTVRNHVFETCSRFFSGRKKSINIESLQRLTAFVEAGDPFIWNVFVTGICVFSRPAVDTLLGRVGRPIEFGTDAVVAFLTMKASVSSQLLLAAIEATRVHLHVAAMSLAQAEILKTRRVIYTNDLLAVSDYRRLIQDCGGWLHEVLLASFAAHSHSTSTNDPVRAVHALAELLVAKSSEVAR